MRKRKINLFISILFEFFIALLLTAVGVTDLHQVINLSQDGQRTSGIIIARTNEVRNLGALFCRFGINGTYTVEYKTLDSKMIRVKEAFCSRLPHNPQDKVQLIYSRRNPEIMLFEYSLAGTQERGILGTILGSIFLMSTIIQLRKFKRMRKNKSKQE